MIISVVWYTNQIKAFYLEKWITPNASNRKMQLTSVIKQNSAE